MITDDINVLTNLNEFVDLCNGHFFIKRHNAYKIWNVIVDKYCRANVIGSLVIKRFEDAEVNNDNILNVILDVETNYSAEAIFIIHPHADYQTYLSRQMLRQAGVNPLNVSYVELHDINTQIDDHEEMQGIMQIYAPLIKRRSKNYPLNIDAVKANVGHSEFIAGITILIKIFFMFQKNAILSHIDIKSKINPRFPRDFDKRNLQIPLKITPWQQVLDKRRFAIVNNFGAAGGNTIIVLEEAPIRNITKIDPR